MTLAGSAQTLYQRTKKGSGSACRFDGNETSQITLNVIANQVEDQLDDPLARKYLTMLTVDIGDQVWKNLRDER